MRYRRSLRPTSSATAGMLAGWSLLGLAWFVLPFTDPAPSTVNLFVLVGIHAIVAYGVAFLFGGGGLLSIAHGGLWGVGAYTGALLSIHFDWSMWPSIPVAMVIAGALAAVMGYPSLRVKGHYFVIVTFAFAELVRVLASNWSGLTRGDVGISLVTLGEWGDLVSFESRTHWYYGVGVLVAIVVVAVHLLYRSDFGQRLVALRENEELAQSVAIDTTRVKVWAFVISGMLAGLSGVLWANYVRFVHPGQFGAEPGLIVVLMVLLGGARSLAGPILGAIIVVVLPARLGFTPVQNLMALGAVLIGVILLFPQGIVPILRQRLARLVARFRPAAGADEVAEVRPATEGVPTLAPSPNGGERSDDEGPLLVATGIKKHYGGVRAVEGVDITFGRREVVAVVGPNGSGKSTLFNVLSGFTRPDAGSVEWMGRDLVGARPFRAVREGLVRTFQERMVFPGLTVERNLAAALIDAGREATPETIEALARYVRVEHRLGSQAESLSWGESRLLGIALAVANQPRLLLLDEPFAGLSPIAAQDVTEILERLIADGFSLGIIDHEMAYLLPLCDRVVVLDHGQQIFEGEPSEFLEDEAVAGAYLGVVDASL